MIEAFRVERLVANRIVKVTRDDCRSSDTELTSDIVVRNISIVIVNDSRDALEGWVY